MTELDNLTINTKAEIQSRTRKKDQNVAILERGNKKSDKENV